MDDYPLTPGQKSEPRKIPREKKEGKGKQPANGKPSYKKSSKSRSDNRQTRSSPGKRSATVEGAQSFRSVPASALRSTSADEHDSSNKLSLSSEFTIHEVSESTNCLRTTYSQDGKVFPHRYVPPSMLEQEQEVVVEGPVEPSLQEVAGTSSQSRRRPPTPPIVTHQDPTHMHQRFDITGQEIQWVCKGVDCSPGINVRKRKDPPALSDEAIDELIKRHKKPTPETNFVEPVRLPGPQNSSGAFSSRDQNAPPESVIPYLQVIMAQQQRDRDLVLAMQEKLARVLQAEPVVPGVEPRSFSEIFREDPIDMNSLLEALKDNFPKIIEVFHAENFHHLAYNYSASPTGFWSIPPAFGYDGLHRRNNTIGCFKELDAPTIRSHWKPKALNEALPLIRDDGVEIYPQRDPLHKPVIPGKCEDPDLNAFLEGPALAVLDSSFLANSRSVC